MPKHVARGALAAAVAGALLFGAAGCGGDNSGKTTTSSGSGSSTTLSPADKLLQEGLDAEGTGDLDTARAKYLEVIKLDPTNKFAHYDLGVIYQQINDVPDARSEYEKAIAIDSKYAPALFNLAILETGPNPARAEDLYRQLLAINANDANVLFNLGLLLNQEGKTDEGSADIDKAVSIDPSLASRIPNSSTTSTTAAGDTTTTTA